MSRRRNKRHTGAGAVAKKSTAGIDSSATEKNIAARERQSASSNIRMATYDDLVELVAMGMELHAENGIMNSSPQLIAKTALAGIDGESSTLAVIGDVGKLEGMIFLTISRFYYTNDLHLEELFIYVRPQYRKSGNARALIGFAKRSAIELGIPLLVGVVSNVDTERKVAMYKRMLGEPAGAYFLFNGKTGSG